MSRPLRVLHGTYEIAGQGMMLAQALRGKAEKPERMAHRCQIAAAGRDVAQH